MLNESNALAQQKDATYYGIVPQEKGDEYLAKVHRHIAYVQEFGKALGLPDSQLDDHDKSKLTEIEFVGYSLWFPDKEHPHLFARAWLHHIHNNPHHWDYWLFPTEKFNPEGLVVNRAMQMPDKYAVEMIADWQGASKEYSGDDDMSEWLVANVPQIVLHPKTAIVAKQVLCDIGYASLMDTVKFIGEI